MLAAKINMKGYVSPMFYAPEILSSATNMQSSLKIRTRKNIHGGRFYTRRIQFGRLNSKVCGLFDLYSAVVSASVRGQFESVLLENIVVLVWGLGFCRLELHIFEMVHLEMSGICPL